jgi:hypothetical protein
MPARPLVDSAGRQPWRARVSGEVWTVQADLQPISFKCDRLLDKRPEVSRKML